MRGVTIQELTKWLRKNEHRTWAFENFGKKGSTLEIKYLDFSIDTRDGMIWRVAIRGSGADEVAIRDDNERDKKTILDKLEEGLSDASR